jgi:hypothetical protein
LEDKEVAGNTNTENAWFNVHMGNIFFKVGEVELE